MSEFSFTVASEEAGVRLDSFLAGHMAGQSRSFLQKLIEEERVLADGQTVRKNYRVASGAVVSVKVPEPEMLAVKAEAIPLEIVYEDTDLLVVNKPKGMVVHPAAGHEQGTLVNALLYHCGNSLSGINGVLRPGIVHRIDKDTSGLLIVAKSDRAHHGLAEQIKQHSFLREYEAVAYGSFPDSEGTVDLPVGRSKQDRKKMCVTMENSRPAVTHYHVLESFPGFTHIRCRLETGRTHQIRVHMSYLGHPLAGDPVYGPKKVIRELEGQCLHAKTIGFVHPVTGDNLFFTTELPDYFVRFLNKLSKL